MWLITLLSCAAGAALELTQLCCSRAARLILLVLLLYSVADAAGSFHIKTGRCGTRPLRFCSSANILDICKCKGKISKHLAKF